MSSREDASEPGRAFDPGEDLERVFRAEFGRMVAVLTHRFGDLSAAGSSWSISADGCDQSVHTDAPTAKDTDWHQILALYDQLVSIAPTPVVMLNRAVGVAEVHGPSEALPIIDGVDLAGYHPFHATRADVLRRLGRTDDARVEYAAAIRTAANPAEIALLTRRADELV